MLDRRDGPRPLLVAEQQIALVQYFATRHFGWATGEPEIATYVGIAMIYLSFFLTEAVDISPVWAGIALLIPRLWDVITDPIMRAISDHTKTRLGHRRPYLLAGSLLFGPSFFLIFAVPGCVPF